MGTLYDELESYTLSKGSPAGYYSFHLGMCLGKSDPTFGDAFDDWDFQKSIAFFIEEIGIPVTNVAKYLHVSNPTVACWREGKRLPPASKRWRRLVGLVDLLNSRHTARRR
jgi:hypothetical protein